MYDDGGMWTSEQEALTTTGDAPMVRYGQLVTALLTTTLFGTKSSFHRSRMAKMAVSPAASMSRARRLFSSMMALRAVSSAGSCTLE